MYVKIGVNCFLGKLNASLLEEKYSIRIFRSFSIFFFIHPSLIQNGNVSGKILLQKLCQFRREWILTAFRFPLWIQMLASNLVHITYRAELNLFFYIVYPLSRNWRIGRLFVMHEYPIKIITIMVPYFCFL